MAYGGACIKGYLNNVRMELGNLLNIKIVMSYGQWLFGNHNKVSECIQNSKVWASC